MKKAQVNMWVLEETKEELMRIARTRSIEKDETVTHLDLLYEYIHELIKISGSKQ